MAASLDETLSFTCPARAQGTFSLGAGSPFLLKRP
jgi:hypothetical protein